jgi:simple sugar transport system ATP-binding protein
MRGFIVDKQATIASTQTIMEEFDVRAPGPQTLAAALSGGNQQKFIVGREMSKAPALLLASHPTRGVDVGSIEYIHSRIVQERDAGTAVLIVSTELEEVMALSDRLLVMYRGKVVAELDPTKVTPMEVGLYMAGSRPDGVVQK